MKTLIVFCAIFALASCDSDLDTLPGRFDSVNGDYIYMLLSNVAFSWALPSIDNIVVDLVTAYALGSMSLNEAQGILLIISAALFRAPFFYVAALTGYNVYLALNEIFPY